MNRSRLVQLLKARSPLVALVTVAPLIVVILGLTACVKHPVGDSEKAKVDPAYSGVWVTKDASGEGSLLFLRPYDARTYFANIFSYRSNSGVQPTQRFNCKAWLTTIGGAVFLTLEPLNCDHFAGVGDQPPYLVAKVSLADGSLHLHLLNGDNDAVKSASNSRELEAAIEKGVNSDALYGGEVTVFKKADDKVLIKSVLEAFRPAGCTEW